jgi:uncharacterized membrane protein YeiH
MSSRRTRSSRASWARYSSRVQPFEVPWLVDYAATFLWAASGGLVAARKGYDIVGISGIALVTATGGGLVRDGLFLQNGPPVLVRTPIYLGLVAIAALTVILVGRRLHGQKFFAEAVAITDAIGLGAYAVVGSQLALGRGLSLPGVVLVGVTNAVGGGVLRDLLLRKEPEIFKPGTIVALAALSGCAIFLLLTRWLETDERVAAWVTIGAVSILRGISVTYDLRTRAIIDGEDEPRG